MRFELLVFSHCHHGFAYRVYTMGCEMLEGDFAIIAVEVDTIICQGIAVSRQGVVGAAGIVASTLASIFAKEYATRIYHHLCQLLIVVGRQDEMLRRIGIGKSHGFGIVSHDYYLAVVQSFGGNLFARKASELFLYLSLHL